MGWFRDRQVSDRERGNWTFALWRMRGRSQTGSFWSATRVSCQSKARLSNYPLLADQARLFFSKKWIMVQCSSDPLGLLRQV